MASRQPTSAVEAVGLERVYVNSAGIKTYALHGVSFNVDHGDFVAIIGPSGSGKTTLLNLVGGLDRPTGGKVFIDGEDTSKLRSRDLARIRNQKIGFVFQSFNLIERLTAWENIELPLMVRGVAREKRKARAMALLDGFGIASEAERKPSQLSGGEQQRVAVARALAADPPILLGDEPTGNLDTENTRSMMNVLKESNSRLGKTLIIITHNPEVASQARRTISIRDGRIQGVKEN